MPLHRLSALLGSPSLTCKEPRVEEASAVFSASPVLKSTPSILPVSSLSVSNVEAQPSCSRENLGMMLEALVPSQRSLFCVDGRNNV